MAASTDPGRQNMASNSNPSRPDESRRRAIADLLRKISTDSAAGKTFDEVAIAAAHPELLPELLVELRKIRAIKDTRGPTAIGVTMLPPADGSYTMAAPIQAESATGIPGYSLQREIGRGGQAIVYLAIQQSTGRKVAIKIIRKEALADERSMARYRREVQVLAALDHPYIVGIVDTGAASDGSQFIVMNYIAGATLDEYMKYAEVASNRGKLLRLFLKICEAVNTAHVRGIVHRDLKPGNIRIDERGEPHILDFGLAATALDHLAGGDHPKSVTGEFLGSLPWCSP
jgi:serine/threonine protein kinase